MKTVKKYSFLYLTSVILIIIFLFSDSKLSEAANNGFNIKNGVLIGYYGTDKNVTIPKSVKEIGDKAFYN